MLTTKELSIVYQTLLTSPGMSEGIKISLTVSRRQALLLTKMIELGLTLKDSGAKAGILSALTDEDIQQANQISQEVLKKSGLIELHDRIGGLQSQ